MLKKFLLSLALLGAVCEAEAAETYDAAVNVDTEARMITGTLTVTADKKSEISVNVDGFHDIAIDGTPLRIKAETVELSLEKGVKKTVSFKKSPGESDIISEDFISVHEIVPAITGGSDAGSVFSVTLPKGFEAVSSGETVKKTEKRAWNEFVFTMTKPIETFSLIASSNYAVSTAKVGGVEIAAYFFKEDKGFAGAYLEKAAEYIKSYEELLRSEFPYKRFSIVEHKVPYGYASPTYTVMGSSVIRLPFILSTSLGHEILHQWFGSAIGGGEGGNWFEAVTTYYTDMNGLPTEAEKEEYRKNIIASYENYIKDGESYPLKDFRYNDSRRSQSVGYGKGAMVFHMLKMELGADAFDAGMRRFVNGYKYKNASWDDIFASFQGADLKDFSHYWINESGIPEIIVSRGSFFVERAEPAVKFTLTRNGGPEKMLVPYTVFYKDGMDEGLLQTVKGSQEISVPVKSMEARLVIDSDYDIMRRLSPAERPASVSGLLASRGIIGVTAEKNSCGSLFEAFGVKDVRDYKNVSFTEFMDGDIIICGFDNPALKPLFPGLKADKRASSEYMVFKNPHSTGKYIMAARNPAPENVRLLSHYGKYAALKFSGAKNTEKTADSTDNGIEVAARGEDRAVETRSSRTMGEVVKVAGLYPAVFVGERHDNYAHHMNQLEIIKRLKESGLKVAVGFEMVQKQFQPVLSSFIAGDISEAEFLDRVEYHDRWGFDYNLYAPIFRYLRDNGIPAAALNIDGAIIKKISSGKAGELTAEELAQLPEEMKLSNRDYEREIREIFNMHPPKAASERSFSDFYLAQNVWDETMAESIVRFQRENPGYMMVIIAGSGHVGKNSGIPLRYERLTGKKPFVITQDDALDGSRSDVVFATEPVYSEGTPKLGITLKIEGENPVVESVDKGSPAAEAGIKAKDAILACGGRPIGNKIGPLRYALFEAGYGSEITCSVKRGGKTLEVKATLKPYEEDKEGMMQKLTEMMKEKGKKAGGK